METADRSPSKSGQFKAEMQDFTPLQLALVTPHSNPDIVKSLFGNDANHNVKETSTGSNILHLVAKNTSNIEVLEYVVKNAKVNIFERNNAGDTPLTIVTLMGNTRGAEIIEEC